MHISTYQNHLQATDGVALEQPQRQAISSPEGGGTPAFEGGLAIRTNSAYSDDLPPRKLMLLRGKQRGLTQSAVTGALNHDDSEVIPVEKPCMNWERSQRGSNSGENADLSAVVGLDSGSYRTHLGSAATPLQEAQNVRPGSYFAHAGENAGLLAITGLAFGSHSALENPVAARSLNPDIYRIDQYSNPAEHADLSAVTRFSSASYSRPDTPGGMPSLHPAVPRGGYYSNPAENADLSAVVGPAFVDGSTIANSSATPSAMQVPTMASLARPNDVQSDAVQINAVENKQITAQDFDECKVPVMAAPDNLNKICIKVNQIIEYCKAVFLGLNSPYETQMRFYVSKQGKKLSSQPYVQNFWRNVTPEQERALDRALSMLAQKPTRPKARYVKRSNDDQLLNKLSGMFLEIKSYGITANLKHLSAGGERYSKYFRQNGELNDNDPAKHFRRRLEAYPNEAATWNRLMESYGISKNIINPN